MKRNILIFASLIVTLCLFTEIHIAPETSVSTPHSVCYKSLVDGAFYFSEMAKKFHIEELVGKKYGRLTVLSEAGSPLTRTGRKRRLWWFECDCGTRKKIAVYDVIGRGTKSCGCAWSDVGNRNRTHGATRSKGEPSTTINKAYQTWSSAKDRCSNAQNRAYPSYGGRGIAVCDRWLGEDGFSNFIADMGVKPSPKHSLDRINNNGNYEPGNCRWATQKEQCRNTRSNRIIEYNGEKMCIADFCEKIGHLKSTVHGRLVLGWSVDKIAVTPVRINSQNQHRHQPTIWGDSTIYVMGKGVNVNK